MLLLWANYIQLRVLFKLILDILIIYEVFSKIHLTEKKYNLSNTKYHNFSKISSYYNNLIANNTRSKIDQMNQIKRHKIKIILTTGQVRKCREPIILKI